MNTNIDLAKDSFISASSSIAFSYAARRLFMWTNDFALKVQYLISYKVVYQQK